MKNIMCEHCEKTLGPGEIAEEWCDKCARPTRLVYEKKRAA